MNLTPRQIEIFELILEKGDLSVKELADIMGFSPHTVKHYLSQSYMRLGTQTRLGAVLKALKAGIIKLE